MQHLVEIVDAVDEKDAVTEKEERRNKIKFSLN